MHTSGECRRSAPPITARVAAGAALVAATMAHAQAPQPEPGDVDLATSRVYVFVGKTGLGHDHAVVGALQAGRVTLDAAERAGTLVFDMRSFRADTADARKVLGLAGETDAGTQKQVTDNMLGGDVLDVARHPTATFEIRSSLRSPRSAPGRHPVYDLAGAFTLHGVTREVVIPVEAEHLGPVVRLKGGFAVRQTDFGMKPYAKFGGMVGVADELRIYGDLRVVAMPAALPAAPLQPAGAAP